MGASIQRVEIPLANMLKVACIANLKRTARETVTWLSEEQYQAFLKLRLGSFTDTPEPDNCLPDLAPQDCEPGDASHALPPDAFVTVLTELSVRAQNTLFYLGIRDIPAFSALTKWQIQNCRNSGRITTAEIMQAQAKLRSPPEPADNIAPTNPLTYENAPPEVFDAIRSQLGGRANAMLARNAVDNLSAFMKLTNERLLKLRWCGMTNANLILALQTRLAEYAQARAREPSEFRLEMLLWAPCLVGKSTEEKGLAPAEGVHVDPENPAPWLLNWIRELAQTDKYARVFMLRMGMLGSAPATLESIGQRLLGRITGLERCRRVAPGRPNGVQSKPG